MQSVASAQRPVRAALLCVLLASSTLAIPFVPHVGKFALAVGMIGVGVAYLALRRARHAFDWFEVFIPYSATYVVGYGVSALVLSAYPELAYRKSLIDYLTPAAALGLVGYASFVAGYAVSPQNVRSSRLGRLDVRGISATFLLGCTGLCGYLARVALDRGVTGGGGVSAGLSAAGHLAPLFFFAWFLAWFEFLKRRSVRNAVLLIALAPVAAAILTLTLGGKGLAVTVLGLPAVASWYARGRLPLKTFAVLVLILVFVIFPVYNTYRWTNRDLSTGQRLDRALDSVQRWNPETFVDRSVFAFAGRVATITSTAAVLRDVPRWVDYRYGDTIFLAPVSILIPRFLWPDKPGITIGREFAVTFGLVNPDDRATQIASSWVGELYWNFHIPGVVLGMFLIGFCYRWCYLKWGRRDGGDEPVRRAFYIVMLLAMLQAEGDLAANAAGIVKVAIILTIVIKFLVWIGAFTEANRAPVER